MNDGSGQGATWIRGDAHVHLHPVFERERFLGRAMEQAETLGSPFLLCLTEIQGVDAFGALAAGAASAEPANGIRVTATGEPESLAVTRPGEAAKVFCLAGQQRVSTEGIEVLAIGARVGGADGFAALEDRAHSAEQLLRRALGAGLAAGLPWGVGKWLGARGREVARLAADPEIAAQPRFFLGDIAARCWPWPRPRPFATAPRVLAGTDLLPRPGAEADLGLYRFAVEATFDPQRPAASLLAALADAARPVRVEGRREHPWETVYRQLDYRRRGGGQALVAQAGPSSGAGRA